MKRRIFKIIAALIAVIACLYVFSSDFRQLFSIYAKGESAALAQYDRDNLSIMEQGALSFTMGDYGGLTTDTLQGSATPWVISSAALTLDYVDGDIDRVNWDNTKKAFQHWGFCLMRKS